MLAPENLKDLLGNREYSRLDKVMLCMAVDDASPKTVSEIRSLAVSSGLTEAKKWNLSDILRRAKGLAMRTSDGWELTSDGRHGVGELAGPFAASVAPRVAASLRHHMTAISSADGHSSKKLSGHTRWVSIDRR